MAEQQILIVDDRPTNRTVFAKLASSLGPDISVRTSGNPIEALALLDGYTPDLVIVDYSMPEMNGADFTREVRRRAATHDVPVVVITAYDDRDFRLSALEAGATDFLQSPVDRREFQSRVTAMLAFRRQQTALRTRTEAVDQAIVGNGAAGLRPLGDIDVLSQVLDTLPVMACATDLEGRCLFVNALQAAMFGVNPLSLIGEHISPLLGEGRGERDQATNGEVLATGRATATYEETIEQDGIPLVFLTQKAPLRGPDGKVVAVLTSAIDITARKHAETHLNHIARHDVLTGLPNRILFRDRLQAQIAAAREKGRLVAVFLIDMDRFKFINDTRGHRAGDQLLEQVAARIVGALGASDTAARLGGDEFAIILGDLKDRDEAARRASVLLQAIGRSYRLDGHDMVLTSSIGISLWPSDSATPDELLRTADLAMYAGKAAGGNAYRFFDKALDSEAQRAAALEADLHLAVEREEFELFYQPLFNARTGKLASAEALVRWNHPAQGRLGPGEFLKLADETGLILPLGAWVMRAACRQQVAWAAAGLHLPRISVNLSPVQFRQDVLEIVRRVIAETGVRPTALELEIVESLLVTNRDVVAETLRRIRELGVRVSIDDFGTGYSSLQYLRDLPVDSLKIDRCFVDGLPNSDKDAAIIHAMTSMAHDLGLEIVAEGVETDAQQVMLRTIGCDRLQGFYLGRPLAAAEFAERFLRSPESDRPVAGRVA